MSVKLVPIDWDALETAVERNSPDSEGFLDLETGRVVSVCRGQPEAKALNEKISANISRYVRIEPASSREQYRWMERFVSSVADEPLRKRLVLAIDGKGAFRRFKDVLLAYPAERERWFAYRATLLHWHIHNWLENNGISASEPWGAIESPPAELEVVDAPTPPSALSPGEALRREARELIDGIPTMELSSAIAFLQFLQQKGQRAPSTDSDETADEEDQSSARSTLRSVVP